MCQYVSILAFFYVVYITARWKKETRGNVDIDVEFRPEDNPYLIVHECSGFDPQVGDSQNLQTIWEFISYRTHATRSPSERLHAVW
jgi:hypothetical protein